MPSGRQLLESLERQLWLSSLLLVAGTLLVFGWTVSSQISSIPHHREPLLIGAALVLSSGFWLLRQKRILAALRSMIATEQCVPPVLNEGQFDGLLRYLSESQHDNEMRERSEERFTEFFEALQEAVYFSTPSGEILNVNPAMVRLMGYDSREELLGRKAQDLYHRSEERDQFQRELEAGGFLRDWDATLKRKDGTLLQCLECGSVIHDAAGRIIRYQSTIVDITKRKEMEERLHREQEFVRRLVDGSPDTIAVLDGKGIYTFVSSRVESLIGLKAEQIIGKHLGLNMVPDDLVKAEDLFRALMRGEMQNAQFQCRLLHRDGSMRTVRANAAPLTGADGSIVSVIVSARDVTESRKAEQALLQTEKLASIGQMLAGAAHELNNPLTAIIGMSELLRARASDDLSRHQADVAHQQARRAADIVNSLLTISQPAMIGHRAVCLEDILRQAIRMIEEGLDAASVTVELLAPPDAWHVQGDSAQLVQVFLNLIVNAQQAIQGTGSPGKITISILNDSGRVVVEVRDSGPGVSQEILPYLFDPFFTTKRPGGGTGLGLTLSLALVKGHGGTIEAQSIPEGGALFRVVLPAVTSGSGSTDLPRTKSKGARLSGWRVLVIEDEPEISSLLRIALTSDGAEVECVGGMEAASAALSKQAFDGIVCDLGLPRQGGLQLFDLLSSQMLGKDSPVVFITGALPEEEQLRLIRERGAECLQKPFEVGTLVRLFQEKMAIAPTRL